MSGGPSRPARPHLGLTADGRQVSQVLTYARRGSRLNERQEAAWQRRAGQWWVPDEAVDRPGFDITSIFGREAPLIVEIGSGVGEATAGLAATRSSSNILAIEVWQPGIAETMWRLERAGVENVRLMSIDAVWSMEHLFPPASVTELWTFFPDPWPKKRHQRRRLVNASFVATAASRLVPGGLWRLATDWPEYADQMAEMLSAEPALANVHEGFAPRWEDRPATRFERRGLAAGRTPVDLTYRRLLR